MRKCELARCSGESNQITAHQHYTNDPFKVPYTTTLQQLYGKFRETKTLNPKEVKRAKKKKVWNVGGKYFLMNYSSTFLCLFNSRSPSIHRMKKSGIKKVLRISTARANEKKKSWGKSGKKIIYVTCQTVKDKTRKVLSTSTRKIERNEQLNNN